MTFLLTGWMLDLHEDCQKGVAIWFIGDDGSRRRLHQPLTVTFYAAGSSARLRALWCWLMDQPVRVELAREERRDIFREGLTTVLRVSVPSLTEQAPLFRRAAEAFPDLTYYDADLQLSLRYCAATGVFPLARCRVEFEDDGLIRTIEVLDSPWDLDPWLPELRVLRVTPDMDPSHADPHEIVLTYGRHECSLALEPVRALLVNLRSILERFDPDVVLTDWGDTWLMPRLFALEQQTGLPLPLNREPGHTLTIRDARFYFSYGQIIYKGQQVHLFGRCHIDQRNAALWGDYGLEGTIESARVTCLPLQTAARVSPGTGISSMQILTALRDQFLVPWHKQQVEKPKTALELLQSDQGGMIYMPICGLHEDVGMVDFVSMYPSIMVHSNISPEVPAPTELGVSENPPGLIPQTLGPLLEKRIALKQRSASLPEWDPRHVKDKARSQAYKWLLVTCFGYLGYKNARFGRIESHEAVTRWGREALLRAKEAAEDLGFEVLHMYVDGLWVKKPGTRQPADFTDLLAEVSRRTHLPVGLDGVFRWVAFLPSRVDERIGTPNRYFGMFQDGSFKVRGVDARRRDTPAYVGHVQMELLNVFKGAETAQQLRERVPQTLALLKKRVRMLRRGEVPLKELLVGLKLSRELEAYKDLSAAARAALQLREIGKSVRPGQRVYFLYLRGHKNVHAWDLPTKPDPRALDIPRYVTLLVRAAGNILQPLGVTEDDLRAMVAGGCEEELPGVWREPARCLPAGA